MFFLVHDLNRNFGLTILSVSLCSQGKPYLLNLCRSYLAETSILVSPDTREIIVPGTFPVTISFSWCALRNMLRRTVFATLRPASLLSSINCIIAVSVTLFQETLMPKDRRIYRDFGQALIKRVRPLYAEDSFRLDIDNMVYAFDSSTISLCLKLCPWARFRTTKAGVKIHTLLDLRGGSSGLYPPDRCFCARCQGSGQSLCWDGSYLSFGQKLCWFHQTLQPHPQERSVLRHKGKGQHAVRRCWIQRMWSRSWYNQ